MAAWRGRTVLVTGATGLVGSWLCRDLLAQGAQVVALVRDWNPRRELIRSGDVSRCLVVSGRLEEASTLSRAIAAPEVDTVFHLGAQAIVGTALREPLATLESNVLGTANVLEACRRHHPQVKRIVVASSDKAYGTSEVLPYTEAMPPLGRAPYDVSKSCTDLVTQAYAATYGLPVAIARCGNIYGAGDLHWNRLVPGTVRCALEGRRPEIRSDGSFLRDYVYVKDAVSAYLSLADALDRPSTWGEAFNFGPSAPLSVLQMVQAILQATGRTDLEPVIRNDAVAEIRNQYLDASKARDQLGWAPAWSLEAGLAETVPWYRDVLRERP
jgi:CDP-glucose 4,6-dehydratase